jgi:hypothetical protein
VRRAREGGGGGGGAGRRKWEEGPGGDPVQVKSSLTQALETARFQPLSLPLDPS